MNIYKYLIAITCIFLSFQSLDAVIRLTEFENNSSLSFKEETMDGRPIVQLIEEGGLVIDRDGTIIESEEGDYRIIFEDAHRSGYHRPHWKFHVWVESKEGFPLIDGNRILYAVIFYDGQGCVSLKVDQDRKLIVSGGHDCVDILYPWKVGMIGRGNPYNQVKNNGFDENEIVYFDYNGFVAYPLQGLIDPIEAHAMQPRITFGDIE